MIAISTIRIDRLQRSLGFTLIEVLVVLTIMALVAMMAVNAFRSGHPLAAQSNLQQTLRLIQKTRSTAILSGKVAALEAKELPAGFTIADQSSLRWYPDGSASAGSILDGPRLVLSIDAVTGLPQERQAP